MRLTAVAVAALMLVSAASAAGATYRGVAKEPAVIWVTDAPPSPAPDIEIRQTMRAFVPALLVVPVGASVKFPNDDGFYHSVYSDSPGNQFDLGLYDTGPGKSVRFISTGIVQIRCHVHGSMAATIVVVDGPYAQTQRPNDAFHIDGITPGRHVVHVWSGGTDVAETNAVVR